MSKAKRKGTSWETAVAAYLSNATGLPIERRALSGTNDRGDIQGLAINGKRIVVECKNCKRYELSEWLDEAAREGSNDNAEIYLAAVKRAGKGFTDKNGKPDMEKVGKHMVVMELDVFARLLRLGENNE